MAYMKDSTGRRLDSFAVAGLTETLPRHNSIISLGTSFTEGNYGPGTVNPLRYQDRGYFNWAMAFPHASAGHPQRNNVLGAPVERQRPGRHHRRSWPRQEVSKVT